MIDYKKSGVDIDKGNIFVKEIARIAASTSRREVLGDIGGFSGLVRVPSRYKDPVLVSSTDGVGTKLLVADVRNRHDTIGIDLVAMCVNDVIVTGAEPLFFLDYLATGRLNVRKAKEVVRGIVKGCRLAGCALIGGETAEMPGLYREDQYDIAGFCVGVAERSKLLNYRRVREGDVIIGIQSNGLHSNGFSLARRVFTKKEIKGELGRILLRPTFIYKAPVLALRQKIDIKAMAHITGGGFYDNIVRVMPPRTSCVIYKGLWPVPRIFKVIQERSGTGDSEMYRTFNMGIGMAIIIRRRDTRTAITTIKRHGFKAWKIGAVVKGKREVLI